MIVSQFSLVFHDLDMKSKVLRSAAQCVLNLRDLPLYLNVSNVLGRNGTEVPFLLYHIQRTFY